VTQPVFASGGGFLYMANSDDVPVGHHPTLYQTADMLTWDSAEAVEGNDGTPNWNRNLAVDDNGNCYLMLGGPTSIDRIIRFDNTLASVVFHKESTHACPNNHLGLRGGAIWEQYLYGWTGIHLYQWDTTAGVPVTPAKVDGNVPDNGSTMVATADIVNCGDRVVMFTSMPGMSGSTSTRGRSRARLPRPGPNSGPPHPT
jgi:hypothetical protein